ncbi:hypothetical protein J2X57_002303 [Luteibacter sp. 1214]|nr:hypothetical protein [Luteibacter sp. 1214]
MRHRVWIRRERVVSRWRAGGCDPRGHACGDPSGKGRSAAVYQWPSAGSGSDWGFSSRLSLPPRKRPVIPDRPRLRGLVQSKPSPAATGPEGHPRRLFGVPRWVDGRAGCGFFASLAFRAQGALLQAAMYPPLRSPCGRSEPCSRTLSLTKANEAIRNRQASGPSHEASRGSAARCLSPPKSRRVPPSRPVAAGEGSDWKRPRERGRSRMTGRFRGGRDSRLENPQLEPDPAEGH